MIRLKSLLQESFRTSVDAIGDVINLIAQQFGETVAQFAGGGANGKAWVLQSGKVLKLTADPSEISTALWKKSKGQCKHIVGYYDIRQIINIPTDGINYHSNVYAIIMDGITPLTKEQKSWYSAFYEQYFADRAYPDKDLWMDLQAYNEKYLDLDPAFLSFWNNMMSQRKSVLADMHKQGVYTGECHAGNVGFDRKNPTQFRIYDVWREDSMRKAWNHGIGETRIIDCNKLINNKPDASGIDTPNNPDM
jgi:hypothetical protein